MQYSEDFQYFINEANAVLDRLQREQKSPTGNESAILHAVINRLEKIARNNVEIQAADRARMRYVLLNGRQFSVVNKHYPI